MTSTREWYLLQTKVRREEVARENLERQDYRTWLPRMRVRSRRGTRVEALFPGYLFVHLDPAADNFAPLRSTVGALRLVQFGNVYARVPAELIDRLRATADIDGICEPPLPVLRPGDRVTIIDGIMAGYEAIVTSLRGRERVALLLDIAGRHVGITTSRDAVQPLA